MTETDMIAWFVTDKVGRTGDYWSTDTAAPILDTKNDLKDDRAPIYDTATNTMTFVTRRAMNTGDNDQDFLIKLFEKIPMSYAFRKGSSDWVKHDTHSVWSLQVLEKGVYDGDLDLTDLLRNYEYEAHGWGMWSAWFVVGLLLLVTKRYAKKHWQLMHYLHAVLGLLVLVTTIFYILKISHWDPSENLHNALGTVTLFCVILVSITGSLTASIMRFYYGDKPWSV